MNYRHSDSREHDHQRKAAATRPVLQLPEFQQEPRERCVLMETKSTFPARNALMSPTLVHGSLSRGGPGLPMLAHGAAMSAQQAGHRVNAG